MWGATDKVSWRNAEDGTFGSLNNHDAHIFNHALKPKASAYTLAAIFHAYVLANGL
jgi:GH35 family endo-1,4-beta-xylanase